MERIHYYNVSYKYNCYELERLVSQHTSDRMRLTRLLAVTERLTGRRVQCAETAAYHYCDNGLKTTGHTTHVGDSAADRDLRRVDGRGQNRPAYLNYLRKESIAIGAQAK